jgi:hypothetical protein
MRLVIPNRPGTGGQTLDALAEAGINLEGLCVDLRPGEKWVFVHMLIEDADADKARATLEKQGIQVASEHDVAVKKLRNEPGAIAGLLHEYAHKGENVEILYTITGDRVVVGTEAMRAPIPGVRISEAKYD